MTAYFDAIAPEAWLATKTGFTGTPTLEQLKWNAKARNAIFEAISEEVFARVIFGRSSLKFMKAPLKFVSKNITYLKLSMILLKC